ncbi:MAG: carbon starvation protein A [Deltaproteobacteria bacterium]|nr:carbon starvation protein A [Deltaproteobacteria bacterium]
MSSVALLLGALLWLALAYRVWGRHVAKRLVEPDDGRAPPSETQADGVDFYPSAPPLLFGHHFSSIAGAGPIIGPVIAVAVFGWGGTLAWILLGVVFIGAVHDYLSLMLSVRNGARSTADVAADVVGRRARTLFLVFVWLTLVLIIAVFADAVTKTVLSEPQIVIPTLGLIPLAMVFGVLVNKLRWPLVPATLGAAALGALLFWAGFQWPLDFGGGDAARWTWIALFLVYAVLAASIPVWILLQPRDYLSSWILFGGMGLGILGVLVGRPELDVPAFQTAYSEGSGPIWPMLFILVACGAVSGFHTLVASGTTARQLRRESDALPVAFGSMLAEAALAVLVLVCMAAGVSAAGLDGGALAGLVQQKGPIGAFGVGYGGVTAPLVGAGVGKVVGVVMVNAFVLTTLDTSVRLARFATVELFGKRVPLLRNRWLASALVVGLAAGLLVSGSSTAIWPVFGAANQLMAALALIVITAWLLSRGKPALYTLLPCAFMLVTTVAALGWQAWNAFGGAQINWPIGVSCVVLLGLALFLAADSFGALRALRRSRAASPGT